MFFALAQVKEWNTDLGRIQRRHAPVNILRDRERLESGAARGIRTELGDFLLFFRDDILEEKVSYANEKLERATEEVDGQHEAGKLYPKISPVYAN